MHNYYWYISLAKVTNLFADSNIFRNNITEDDKDSDDSSDEDNDENRRLIVKPKANLSVPFVGVTKQFAVITFNKAFLVNHLVFQEFPGTAENILAQSPFSYFIEISNDGTIYYKLIDYSSYNCYGKQDLIFPAQAIR